MQLTENIRLEKNEKGLGRLLYEAAGQQAGEMEVSVTAEQLTVYHTEVQPRFEGKGIAGRLLEALVRYARDNGLKVRPLCPYVYAQFKRHPEQYRDLWTEEKANI